MHRIHRSHFDAITNAKTPADQLEHATIPAYLCGYFTLKPGSNKVVADIILGVAIEEMLHMTIAENLLIALGGTPAIDTSAFVPRYPGPCPWALAG